jgi:hypothetical protein
MERPSRCRRTGAVPLSARWNASKMIFCFSAVSADSRVDDRERDALAFGRRDVERDAALAGELEGVKSRFFSTRLSRVMSVRIAAGSDGST